MSDPSPNNSPRSTEDLLSKNAKKRTPPVKAITQIESALAKGEFDNLPGKGKPLKLDSNPFTKETAVATELLKNSGFTLPWIQEKEAILTAVAQAEKKLTLIWARYDGSERSKTKWLDAKAHFSQTITQLNKKILTFNLKIPSVQLHIAAIQTDRRIRAVQESL